MKRALVFLAIVFALVAGGLYWAYNSIDVIVRMALEHYGPDVLGTTVKVDSVHLSAATGEGSVKSLDIGTPRGFSAPRTARFGEIRISLDPATVTEKVIHVREITVDAPFIAYERGKEGTNLDAIQKNIDAYVKGSGGESTAKAPGDTSGPRRFVIDRLSIRGAKVTMTNPALKGQGLTFDLPDIQMRDLGKRQNGLRASEVANLVTREVISRIAARVLTNIELLKKGGVEGAVDALKGLFK